MSKFLVKEKMVAPTDERSGMTLMTQQGMMERLQGQEGSRPTGFLFVYTAY